MSINFVSNKNGSPNFFTLEESKYTPEKKNLTVPPERSTSKMFRRNSRSSTSLAISVLEENFEFYHAWTPRNLESLDDYCDYFKQHRPGTSPKSSSVPQHQGENSLEYSDGEFNSSDAFLNNGEQSSPPQHMAETLCLKGLPADVDCETLRDFFSVFGPINDVVILNDDADEEKSTTVAGIVTFKEGSDGAQKALDGQPIQMFGRLIEICVNEATTLFEEKSEKSCSKSVTTFPFKKGRWRPGYTSRAFRNAKWRNFVGAQQNDSLNPSRHSPFPLMVAPPNYGPWRQPCRPVSYLRSDRNSPRKKSNQLQIERVSLVSDVSKRPNSRERTMDVINAIAKQTFLTTRVTSSMFEEDSQRSSSAPQIINSYLARDQEFHHSIDDYSKGLRSNHSTDENNYSRSQNDLIPSRQNSSIHTLLSRSVHNPLFDDGNDYDDVSYPSNNNLQPMPSIHNEELDNGEFGSKPGISQHFHSDSSITSWIWAPNDDDKASDSHNGECEDDCDSETKSLSDGKQISHQTSAIERDLRCTLDWGRAVNASLPLLAVVSIGDHKSDVTTFQIDDGADQRDIESPKNQNNSDACWSGTNLYLLYKATEVTVRKNANIISAPSSKNTAISENKNEKNGDIGRTESAGTGHYTLYQARHPSLASLIAVKKCEVSLQDESDTNNGQNVHSTESIISVFDITPSQHRPLHEWLRTMDSDEYLNKPLFPGMEGHTLEPLGDEITQQSHSTQHHEHEQTSFSAIGVNHDQPNLCQCRRMSNRGISLHRSRQKRPKKRFSAGTAYRADVVDLRIRFLAMQIFHAVNFCHSRGITLGDQLRPDRMFVQDDGWIRLVLPIVCSVALPKRGQEKKTTQTDQIDASTIKYSESVDAPADEIPLTTDRRSIFQKYEHAVTNRGQDSVQIIPYPGYGDVPTVQWQKGSITNLAYLMMLNAAAGRIVGDTTCPPIIPWVTDFTSEIDLGLDSQNLCGRSKSPWRDLSKTKFRLKKGDEQLDHTYLHADPAHHIPETISDLTYTVYRARCLPIHQLRSSVRDPFVPQHYPDSLAKLYEWTPDEATFEFYVSDSDPNIFYSRHSDMPDLSLPPWCENYEKFISYHRSILESGLVSRHLHMWIDLNFGAALSGERAITEKNVVLQRVSWDISADDDDNNCQGGCHSPRTPLQANRKKIAFRSSFRKSVFVQLFPSPHPKKHSNIRNSVSSVFYSALDDQPTQKIDENVLVNRQYVSSNDHTSLQSRKQRDVSMIGAIIQDCYRATRVAPPSDVVNAINELTFGRLDIRKSLEKSNSDDGVLFPFPNHARETYEFLASIQNVEFKRKQMNVKHCDNCDVTLRSSALSRQLSLIRNTDILNTLPISMVGLVMPSILPSLCSAETFVENFRSNRSFSSMADKICEFLIALSKRIPAELIVPHLLKFLESSFHAGNNNLAITEALGKIYLSNTLFSNLYSNSCGEYYIVWLSSFVTMQLSRCKPCTCNSMQETLQMTSVIVFFASLLAQDNLVGPSLCCRYIVPCFVESITKCSRNDRVNPVVQAMKSLLPYIPEDAVGVLICKPILRNIFPSYLPHYCAVQNNLRHHDKNIPESYDFLLDCIGLLRMCVRCLDSDNIVKYFLKTDSGTIVQILLSSFVKEIADKNAPTSRSEYQELNESSRSAEKQPDTLLKETSFLVRDMISHIDLDSINEVFSTIENYCSRVNDEYSTIAMGLYTNKLIDTENTMTLPGVATAVLLAGEMIRVCGREQLRLHCPSALELLTWVNSPEKLVMIMKQNAPLNPSSPKIIPNPSDDRNVASELSSPPRRNTSKTSIDEREGSSLEMRAPMRHNLFNSSIESGDEHRSQGSPLQQQMSGESSATNNNSEASMLFEQNEFRGSKPHNHARYSGLDGEAEKKRELAWVLGLNRRHKEGKVNYSWQPRMMISATLFQSRVNESVRSPIICMAANKPESMLAAGNSNGEILLFDLRRQPPSLICRNRVLDHRFPEHGRSPIKQVDFFDNVGSLLVCNGSLHHYDIETETIISSLSRKNAVLNTASHGNESWLGVDFVGFSNFPKGTGTEEMLHGAIGEVAAISTSHLYTIDLRSQNSVTHWHHLTGTDGHTNRHHKEPLFKSLTWYRESAPTKEHLKVYKGHGFTRLSKYEPNSFNLTCITAHCGGGDWVCVGSSSGHIHCFDRRQGKLLACWKAHSKSVEYLNAVSRHRLISASGDKTAVLWDLSHSPPLKVSRILNIPGKEQAMNVVSHQFRNDGLVSIPEGDLLLCAISGRKAVFQAMPHNSDFVATMFSENESVVDVKAERIVMCDCEGKRISSSEKFNISSVALLPCRQLVLLGCDGEIHVCL